MILVSYAVALASGSMGSDLEARRKALNALLAEQWEYTLSNSPEMASTLGDKRWNDKWSDHSQEAVDRDLAKAADFLKRFAAIDTTDFPPQEVVNKVLMVRDLRERLDRARFKDWEMPVAQNQGIHLEAADFCSFLTFDSVRDYDDYITRLRALPGVFDDTIAQMRRGMADGLMPPRFLLEKVPGQVDEIAGTDPEKSPFAVCLANVPKSIPRAERARIRGQLLAAIRDVVVPAYVKFGRFVKDEYAPNGRTGVGIWSLPDGDARYVAAIRFHTTTSTPPEEIHQLGLREVARIEKEMTTIAASMGYQDLKTFNAAIERNPKLRPHSRQEIVDRYAKYIAQMQARLPLLFGRLPRAEIRVKPMERFREKAAASADYTIGSDDGKRPGTVNVNTGSFASRKTITIETTAYHEGVPGHHLQFSIAQELPTLPAFRQHGEYDSYVEGWALYAEDLGREVGFFEDPYSLYGHLQDEMLRAIRLVVDTGLHYKRWSRQQVVQFFHDHSAEDEVEVQSETDRYIAWPGQALAYKIGQLKILSLREKAKAALGGRFDIRRFHDELLGAGALPLDVLEARMDEWIATEIGDSAKRR
ncbi:MAG: DUF885 family protein [Thermoanaerobaculaceae bacterium]